MLLLTHIQYNTYNIMTFIIYVQSLFTISVTNSTDCNWYTIKKTLQSTKTCHEMFTFVVLLTYLSTRSVFGADPSHYSPHLDLLISDMHDRGENSSNYHSDLSHRKTYVQTDSQTYRQTDRQHLLLNLRSTL